MALGFFDSLISILKFVQISVYGTKSKPQFWEKRWFRVHF